MAVPEREVEFVLNVSISLRMSALGVKLRTRSHSPCWSGCPRRSTRTRPGRPEESLNITGIAPLLLAVQLLVFAVLIGCCT